MQKYQKIDQIENQNRYLIDYANIKCGLIKYQNDFLDNKHLEHFYNKPELGFPLVLPKGIACFSYKKNKKIFSVNKDLFRKKIFATKKKKYRPFLNFFKFGNSFCSGAKPKKKFTNLIKNINKENIKLRDLVLKFPKA